jgi:hypothetical protein
MRCLSHLSLIRGLCYASSRSWPVRNIYLMSSLSSATGRMHLRFNKELTPYLNPSMTEDERRAGAALYLALVPGNGQRLSQARLCAAVKGFAAKAWGGGAGGEIAGEAKAGMAVDKWACLQVIECNPAGINGSAFNHVRSLYGTEAAPIVISYCPSSWCCVRGCCP